MFCSLATDTPGEALSADPFLVQRRAVACGLRPVSGRTGLCAGGDAKPGKAASRPASGHSRPAPPAHRGVRTVSHPVSRGTGEGREGVGRSRAVLRKGRGRLYGSAREAQLAVHEQNKELKCFVEMEAGQGSERT